MEIFFCDLCNESVPQRDLDEGRAFLRKGRVVCAVCDHAMTGAEESSRPGPSPVPDVLPNLTQGTAEAAARARREAHAVAHPHAAQGAHGHGTGAGGVLVGLLALIFAAGGFALILDRLDGMQDEVRTSELELRRDVDGMRSTQTTFVASLDGKLLESEQRVHQARDASRTKIEESIDGLREEFARTGERLATVSQGLGEVRSALDRNDSSVQSRLAALTTQVDEAEKSMRFYSDRLINMEETLRGITTRGIPTGPGPAAGDPVADGGSSTGAKAWDGLIPDLKHENPGIRLDAIYSLGETKDEDVIPHLIPMLTDPDLFVRMATARMLEDLDARTAVPALIDALEDSSSAVREAAMVALRKITGRDFRFEPVASEAERSKRVKSWRDWWKREGDDFLTGGA